MGGEQDFIWGERKISYGGGGGEEDFMWGERKISCGGRSYILVGFSCFLNGLYEF